MQPSRGPMTLPLVRATFALALVLTLVATRDSVGALPVGSNNQTTLKDSLVELETQSWEAWKGRDGAFFQYRDGRWQQD